jgi:hypothetical protein
MQIGPVGIHDVSKKKEIWNDFAKLNSGDLKVIKTKSKEFEKLQLRFDYEGASVIFIETDTKPLRVEIEISNYKHGIEFHLTTTDFIDKTLSYFTKSKIKTSSIEFNQTYLLKCKNEDFVKTIFNDTKIQKLILEEKIMMVSGFVKQSTFRVEIVVNRDINHLDKLNKIGYLTRMIIDKTDANSKYTK